MSSTSIQDQTSTTAEARGKKKLAVLGCGKLGTILLQAFLERGLAGSGEVAATVQHEDKCGSLAETLGGVFVSTNNREAVAGAPIVLIAVKPQTMPQLLEEIAPAIAPQTLVISAVTSTTLPFMQEKLGKDVALIRAMPNTPARVGAPMTALVAGPATSQEQLETARRLFESV